MYLPIIFSTYPSLRDPFRRERAGGEERQRERQFSGGFWALCLSHKAFDIMSVVQMKSIYMHSITNCEPFLETSHSRRGSRRRVAEEGEGGSRTGDFPVKILGHQLVEFTRQTANCQVPTACNGAFLRSNTPPAPSPRDVSDTLPSPGTIPNCDCDKFCSAVKRLHDFDFDFNDTREVPLDRDRDRESALSRSRTPSRSLGSELGKLQCLAETCSTS